LGWYSSRWKSFLEDVKVECCTQQALENPFPSLIHDLLVSITELLLASLVQWLKNGQQVDASVWPAHKPDMARLVGIYLMVHFLSDLFSSCMMTWYLGQVFIQLKGCIEGRNLTASPRCICFSKGSG
ncbi:hypothetical protein CY34DRAFT_102203, partial [Suillus luteus UH-Slu-Lm8-n1]